MAAIEMGNPGTNGFESIGTGTATMNGFDVIKDYKKIRNMVGYMPGRFSLYQDLTVEENLNFFATVFKTTVAENYELIRDIYVQIEPFKKIGRAHV